MAEAALSKGQTVLILGGGVGGLVTANKLRKALPAHHKIIVVERQQSFVFAPSFLWLMTGNRTAQQISRPVEGIEKNGIELVRGTIEKIDAEKREVVVSGKTLTADYLVIALGADLAPENVPGLAESGGHNFYSLEGSEAARDALANFNGGKLVVMTSTPIYKCPAAPYEAVFLISAFLKKRKVWDKTEMVMYAAEPGPMPVAGPDIGKWAKELFKRRKIGYHPEHAIAAVDPAAKKLTFKNGTEANYDLLLYVPPHVAPRVVKESGLTGENGWMAADKHTFATKYDRVYAIGDVVSIPLALGKPLPKAGVFASSGGEAVAQTIAHQITGKGRPGEMKGDGTCFVEIGHGMAAMGAGNFYHEPLPKVKLRWPMFHWHWVKVGLEKYFLWKFV